MQCVREALWCTQHTEPLIFSPSHSACVCVYVSLDSFHYSNIYWIEFEIEINGLKKTEMLKFVNRESMCKHMVPVECIHFERLHVCVDSRPRSTSVGNSRSVVLRDVAFTEKCGWIRKMVPWPRPLIISDDVHAMTIERARCAAYLTIMQSVVTSNMRA